MTRADGERGVALLVALLSVALLTLLVMNLTFASQVGYRRTVHWIQAEQARLIAESGQAAAGLALSYSGLIHELYSGEEKRTDHLLEKWAEHCRPYPPGPDDCPGETVSPCRVPYFDHLGEIVDARIDDLPRTVAIRIDDESGLYNLNRLRRDSAVEQERFEKLATFVGVRAEATAAIARWLSPAARGTTVRRREDSSAADFLTKQAALSYPMRGGSLQSFHELELIPEVKPEDVARLRRVATVRSGSDDDKVNINTAPLVVIRSMDPAFDKDEVIAALRTRRCTRAFYSVDDLVRIVDDSAGRTRMQTLFTVQSDAFRVRSVGQVGDVIQSTEAIFNRPYPPSTASTNRSGWPIELVYQVGRRGPVIDTADWARDVEELKLPNATR